MSTNHPDHIAAIVECLESQGWCCVADFLAPETSEALLAECLQGWNDGGFSQAGVGRGVDRVIREDVRGDHVRWLNEESDGVATTSCRDQLDALRAAINRRLFLGLQDFEGHFAVYPPGGFYQAHLDQHRGTANRAITAILYLNPNWQPAHGGRLKLWTTPGMKDGPFEWIEPLMGSLVIFVSGDHWHEVEMAQHQRHSLTGWFRVDTNVY